MKFSSAAASLTACLFLLAAWANSSQGADAILHFGSQANIGGTFFPGGGLPYVTVPWRTSSSQNIYATGAPSFPDQWYGKQGYALFATTFSYPNANIIPGNSFIDPNGDEDYVNLIDLPSWVADSQVLTGRIVGGWAYALIDDPVLMSNGERWWSFDGVNYPPPTPENNTGQNPWVKLGGIDGADLLGNIPEEEPTGRWSFTVGPNTPSAFRVGVMTGGLDAERFSPTEVFLQKFDGITPVGEPVRTGTLSGPLRDRFVDMHFFDIIGAEEGDTFVFAATTVPNIGGSGAVVSGFSFDVLPDIDADFNDDNVVDGTDFLILQSGFGVGTTHAEGDADSDGVVDNGDLKYWEALYGTASTSAISQVPEPTTLMLLTSCMLTGMLRRQRKQY